MEYKNNIMHSININTSLTIQTFTDAPSRIRLGIYAKQNIQNGHCRAQPSEKTVKTGWPQHCTYMSDITLSGAAPWKE